MRLSLDPLSLDPLSFARSLTSAAAALPRHPRGTGSALVTLTGGYGALAGATLRRTVGNMSPGPCASPPGDTRFRDPAYEDNPYFFALAQSHLLAKRFATDLLDVADLPAKQDDKARFVSRLLLDALSPTNFLLGNPTAVRTAFDSGGKSVARGLRNFAKDLRNNRGLPTQVDASPFRLGESTAASKGKVVYRNDIIELIQYEPTTAEVHSIPLLFCPPWINKYYIMDLAPGRSLIEWAVQHGHTCFAISYRNPDESMRDTSFDDYLMSGPLDAICVAQEISGAPQVNVLAVCQGGTLNAIGLAYLAREGRSPVNSATFLNSHTDFTLPGMLGVFVDEQSVEFLEQRMAKRGYLESTDMAIAFDLLRANDLIFSYVINDWLLGQDPPSFDLLAWNADGTRMAATMHSAYLRSCYLQNDFALGRFQVAGKPVDPRAVEVDSYVLSAVDDHIVPWRSAYKTTQLLGGESRFVLSTSGHIAGIVNPPHPKAKHWTNKNLPTDPELWLKEAELVNDTWWEDWARWQAERAGPMIAAPRVLGSEAYPPLESAPGTYVQTKSH